MNLLGHRNRESVFLSLLRLNIRHLNFISWSVDDDYAGEKEIFLSSDADPGIMSLELKKILVSGIAGGFILMFITFFADAIAQMVAPYNLFELGGMRAVNDPMMMLFFLYPYLFAIIASFVWSWIRGSFSGDGKEKALRFAGILLLLVLVPNIWVMYSTMTYPIGFFLSNILTAVIGYPIICFIIVKQIGD